MDQSTTLEKSLTYPVSLLIYVASVIGTAIFFAPTLGAIESGVYSLIAWIITGVIAIFVAMCFAELASMYPTCGGIYEFSKQAMGRTASFFVGWLALLNSYISVAMVTVGAILYLLPDGSSVNLKWFVLFAAVICIIIFNYVSYIGLKTSTTMLIAFSIITLGTIFIVALPLFFPFNASSFTAPAVSLGITVPIFITIFLISQTFFGWEQATFMSSETINAEKTIPKVLVHGTIIMVLITTLFIFSSFNALGVEGVAGSDRLLVSLGNVVFGPESATIFSILTYLSLIGAVAACIVSTPRLILALSEDGLFIKQLSRISPKYRTPSYAIIFQTIVIIIFLFAGMGSFSTLLEILQPLALMLYCIILYAFILLRIKKPHQTRLYRAPFGIAGSILVILLFITMVVFWIFNTPNAWHQVLLGFSFFVVGIPLFFLIELYNNNRFSEQVKDSTAWYTHWLEEHLIPREIQQHMLAYIGHIKAKTVLEYGSSVGTLTQHLQYAVGKEGTVICVNNSKKELTIISKRLKITKGPAFESMRGNVSMFHHPAYLTKLPDEITHADAVISLDTLSALSDPLPVLKQIAKILPEHAPICFFDYGDFFRLIPDQAWLGNDESIKELFFKAGFSVQVQRRSSLFWSYVFIHGIKSRSRIAVI